eukprot:505280_1
MLSARKNTQRDLSVILTLSLFLMCMSHSFKDGFLRKESLHLQINKNRWIVLRNGKLYSFKSYESDATNTEIFDLKQFNDIIPENENGFMIISIDSKQNRRFYSETKQDANEWIKCIKTVINQHKNNKSYSDEKEFNTNSEPFDKIQCIKGSKCVIYNSMINDKIFNRENLLHIMEYSHYQNEYLEKPQCKYFQKCLSFIRMENGGNAFNDICHLNLYKHPPRNRFFYLSEKK